MKEFKGTPAPWYLIEERPENYEISVEDSWLGQSFASVHNNEFIQSSKGKYNAQLIATAPELLEALQNLYDAIDSCIDLTPELLQASRATINKALGK